MPFVDIALALIMVVVVGWFLNTRTEMAGPIRMVLNVVLMLILVGIALGLINTYIPMAGGIKTILNIVVFVATCIGVLQAFGLWAGVSRFVTNLTHHREPPVVK